MSQGTIQSTQTSGNQGQRRESSEMMKYYLASCPSTATDRLIQGGVKSDQDIKDGLKQKEALLEALVRKVKGDGSK